MFAPRNCLIGLAVLALFQAAAAASPIQVNVTGTVDNQEVIRSFTLSDLSQPIVIGPWSSDVPMPTYGPNGWSDNGNISSVIGLRLWVGPVSSPDLSPVSVTVLGDIQGGYYVPNPSQSTISATINGHGTTASLILEPGTSPADVPPYLADLLNHPERVVFSGSIAPGDINMVENTVTILPPVNPNATIPVPEPSMLLIFLAALAGLPIARHVRPRKP